MNYKLTNSLGVMLCFCLFVFQTYGQSAKIHSHNDYLQPVPLWTAVANQAASIEVDLILDQGKLLVAHDQKSTDANRTLASLYLRPIQEGLKIGAIADPIPFFLMVDLKSDAVASLEVIQQDVAPFVDLMFSSQNPKGLKMVISGNRPPLSSYASYPEYLMFDHQSLDDLADIVSDRIAMVSLPFTDFSNWGGKGRMVEEELLQVKGVIDQVHAAGKPIRFWASPDTKSAWKALADLGVDYINSDLLFESRDYLKDLESRVVTSSIRSELNDLNFENDATDQRVDHVILFIGDGTGLAQISAGMYANGGELNITKLKSIGLAKTQSSDDFTTDSAAGGTALATGQKTHNRAVGVGPDNQPIESISQLVVQKGFRTGIITTDHVTGATGAAFYAHQKDREMIQALTEDLYKSSLNLFVGAGKNDFLRYGNHALDSLTSRGFQLLGSLDQLRESEAQRVGYFASNHGLPSIEKGRVDYLSKGTQAAIEFLKRDDTPFFLMVENGHVDNGGHANEAITIVEEVIDLDRAVGVALKFAQENPHTLVVITADHETGGLTMPQGNLQKGEVELEFSTEDHTAIMVPVFAFGPRSRDFMGVYENTEVFEKLMKILSRDH